MAKYRADADTIELDDHTVLDEDDPHLTNDEFEGGTLFSQSDLTSVAQKVAVYDAAIRAAIDKEREIAAKVEADFGRSVGVEVLFRRFVLPDSSLDRAPVMICKEKANRTRILITNLSDSAGNSVWIGLHPGIVAVTAGSNPQDVVEIGGIGSGYNSREINTRKALYAIAEAGQTIAIDVQEEFA